MSRANDNYCLAIAFGRDNYRGQRKCAKCKGRDRSVKTRACVKCRKPRVSAWRKMKEDALHALRIERAAQVKARYQADKFGWLIYPSAPCKRGHTLGKYTKSGRCVGCSRDASFRNHRPPAAKRKLTFSENIEALGHLEEPPVEEELDAERRRKHKAHDPSKPKRRRRSKNT